MKQHDDPAEKKTPQEDGSSVPSPTETRQRLTKAFFRELLKTSFYPLAAAALIVVGSIAWFVSNARVQSGMVSISSEMKLVRLASTGDRLDANKNFLNLATGTPHTYNSTTYYYTDSDEIELCLSADAARQVYPGASGSITFYIIPTQSGTSTVPLYLGLSGYKLTDSESPSAEPVVDPVLDALLSGHILLFGEHTDGYYSNWLFQNNTTGTLNNSITVTLKNVPLEDVTAGKPYPVTLHWVWPLRYENMKNDLYAAGAPTDKDNFASFIENQADLDNMQLIDGSTYRYGRIFLTNEASLGSEDSRSNAYNLADEYIGTNADYLYLTIQTSPTILAAESDADTGKEPS